MPETAEVAPADLLFYSQVSMLAFSNNQHAGAVALLSLAVLFGWIAGGKRH